MTMKKTPADRLQGKGQKLWKKAKTLIPGGNQLLSKRAEMFLPDNWPAYYSKASGPYVWDLDGRRYMDVGSMAVGSCLLGYADKDVNKAVKEAVDRGSMSTLNAPEEVELAELLCKIHPWADMVRYARGGGESMAIAERIARAYTGRDIILFCGYHGWSDWYLAANLSSDKALDGHLLPGLEPRGVPRGLAGTIVPFHYNNIDELEALAKKYGKKVAAIVMEPVRSEPPENNFLKKVRRMADRLGAVLVFDEISIGWKLTYGGAHLLYGVNPDIAVFSKAMSNGFPMAAVIGRREVMQAAQSSFISSTYWTDRTGPSAALATLKKMKRVNVTQHISRIARITRAGWVRLAKKHGLSIAIGWSLPYSSFTFTDQKDTLALKTLFNQEMLRRGFLATTAFTPSATHTPQHIRQYLKAVDEVFGILADALKKGDVKKRLQGPPVHSHFQRLN
ncbi:MAG: glutamate-1-semialdehyde 2,1-aminomutase [Parcubacteria group bacterium Gr01-1014_8]|nr:MAG: glutamate-1-semialdehyde 2,1-aminomutase [Parcubacteria group bacterium Gr01-1014_8]